MRSKILTIVSVAVFVVGSCFVGYYATANPGEQVVKLTAEKGRGSGADENIKNDSDKNDPNTHVQPPAKKGGEKSRGACVVHIDNRTDLIIKIFFNGNFAGAVAAWGDSLGVVEGQVYARADFTDGTYWSWGPKTADCPGGESVTWQLNR